MFRPKTDMFRPKMGSATAAGIQLPGQSSLFQEHLAKSQAKQYTDELLERLLHVTEVTEDHVNQAIEKRFQRLKEIYTQKQEPKLLSATRKDIRDFKTLFFFNFSNDETFIFTIKINRSRASLKKFSGPSDSDVVDSLYKKIKEDESFERIETSNINCQAVGGLTTLSYILRQEAKKSVDALFDRLTRVKKVQSFKIAQHLNREDLDQYPSKTYAIHAFSSSEVYKLKWSQGNELLDCAIKKRFEALIRDYKEQPQIESWNIEKIPKKDSSRMTVRIRFNFSDRRVTEHRIAIDNLKTFFDETQRRQRQETIDAMYNELIELEREINTFN